MGHKFSQDVMGCTLSHESHKSQQIAQGALGEHLGDTEANRPYWRRWGAQGILEHTGLVETMTEEAPKSQDLEKAWRTGKVTAEGVS